MPSEEEFCGIAAKQELSYDAWGRLRNPATQVAYDPGSEPALFMGRGYTGHEYLPWFGLINKNARLYDPALGRFLSPDPYVQMPDFSQNFNRYSYCLNNPLVYVDEDGESFILVAAIIGAWMGMEQAMISSDETGWGLVGDMFKGALVGGAAGSIGAWAGGIVSSALNFGGFLEDLYPVEPEVDSVVLSAGPEMHGYYKALILIKGYKQDLLEEALD